ncbi:FAD-binding protein [Amycolatopsis sp. H20-H5]|uniref:FAD-binding protein n=1 Tax=Amycolatopsis sp. H20-H5 TaxID=3046309 RepID=UPI002DBDC600|nr:FAD-binding protein [Amycolatopsis sp. H20-H5]MEC3977313.1 FAD-binding protein [Amycolatopsis sp. H20-H5]
MAAPAGFGSIPLGGGTLLTGVAAEVAATDFGRLVRRVPGAVLRPGSVEDVVAAIRWAGAHGLPIAARGAGHAMNGQGLVDGGIILDLRSLNTVHLVAEDRVVVDAGALWSAVVAATTARGLTPPVLTDYLETTVGGTLSAGGLGGMSHRHGAQTDTVLELDVVTGAGELVTCSREHERELFDAVRAGFGQLGVLVRATIRLIPALPMSRCYRLRYTDLGALTADQSRLIAEDRFDYVEGSAGLGETGTPEYKLEVATFVPTLSDVDSDALLAGLRHEPGAVEIEDTTYPEFLDRLAPGVAFRREIKEWELPHPWLNVFLPGPAAAEVVGRIMAELTLVDLAPCGVILLYPVHTARSGTPLLRLPDEPVAFLFALLLTADPAEPGAILRMAQRNRRFYECVLQAGGTTYPIGPPGLKPSEWVAHYGEAWPAFQAAKARFDPKRIMTPGPGFWPDSPA